MSDWPDIPYERWKPTGSCLHMFSQIVGKYRLAHAPWVNHSWHATFYVTARGLTTSLIPMQPEQVEIRFDFIDHKLYLETTDNKRQSIPLGEYTIAEFYAAFLDALKSLGLPHQIDRFPNEVPESIAFDAQTNPSGYDPDAVHDFWQAARRIDRVFNQFRTGFIGKVSPSHLFWGSFDLAVTRFSGRTAPLHPGGFPALPDSVTREAYSHEVSSAGFWPGGGPVDYPAFYSYAYPSPDGFKDAKVGPADAFFDEGSGEFILPYDTVRNAADPDAVLLEFLQSTYNAAADLGKWDRAALDIPQGELAKPRLVV